MQKNDSYRNPGIPVFSFDFNIIDAISATFNSRNKFIICNQKRLKGTQKGPKAHNKDEVRFDTPPGSRST